MPSPILTYDSSKLPDVILANPNHPSADAYIKDLKVVQQQIVDQSLAMDKKTVLAAKAYHTGKNYTDIAKAIGRSAQWSAKAIKTEPAQRLIALLAYYQEAVDGPNEAQRRAMAWRIAVANEHNQPKTSLAALETMNKMDALEREAKNNSSGNVTVIINQQQMPKGALDD